MGPAATDEPGHDAANEPQTGVQRSLRQVVGAIDTFSRWTGYVACILVLPLMATVVSEITWRFLFGSSLFWTYELTYMIYGSLFMLGAAYTLSVGGHIRSDFLYNNFPVRMQGIIDSCAYLIFFFPTIFMLAWLGFDNAYGAWDSAERSIQSAWMPLLWPFKSMIPIGAALLLIQGVSETIRALYAATTGRKL